MKRLFGKRRATRTSPGGPLAQPLCRLGALVFQLNNSDRLYWANPRVPTRIAGCALSRRLIVTRWENVPSEKYAKNSKQFLWRECMAPAWTLKVLLATCPRALLRSTLTVQASAKDAPLGIACRKPAFSITKEITQ